MQCILLFPFRIGLHIIQFLHHHQPHTVAFDSIYSNSHEYSVWFLVVDFVVCLRLRILQCTYLHTFLFFIYFKLFTIFIESFILLISFLISFHYVCDLFPFNLDPDYAIDDQTTEHNKT